MDNTQIDEEWYEIPKVQKQKKSIASVSNTGKFRRVDGRIEVLSRYQSVHIDGKKVRFSHIIAENFLITVKRPDQNQIDHITHNPTEYDVNDVRNLRWCTQKENINFEECRRKMSEAWKTRIYSDDARKHISESLRGKKRGKYRLNYTTWYIGQDGKRIYK